MGSPFNTAQAYIDASGVVHSFSGDPIAIGVCLLLSVAVTALFLYKSFTIHH